MTVPPAGSDVEPGIPGPPSDPVGAVRMFFEPGIVAVVGASGRPGQLGNTVLQALLDGPFCGQVVAVNPSAATVLGHGCVPSLSAAPARPDLAVVCVGGPAVYDTVEECVRLGIPAVAVLAADICSDPARTEGLVAQARAAGVRIVGPNCMGVFSAGHGISWTPRATYDRDAQVSLVSQSGGMAQDLLLAGAHRGVAFRYVASVGNCVDLDEVDMLDFIAAQDTGRAVGLYLEGSHRPRDLLAAIRRVAATVPVVCLKGGRNPASASAVASHTGRIAGDYQLWSALLRQAGAILVRTPEEMLGCLTLLASFGREPGPAVFVGNGGGASVLIADLAAANGVPTRALPDSLRSRMEAELGLRAALAGALWDVPLNMLLSAGGQALDRLLGSLADSTGTGLTVLHLNLVALANQRDADAVLRTVLARVSDTLARTRLAVVLRSDGSSQVDELVRTARGLVTGGRRVPVFTSIESLLGCLGCLARPRPLA